MTQPNLFDPPPVDQPAEATVRGVRRGGVIRGDRFRFIGPVSHGWQEVPLEHCYDLRIHPTQGEHK